MPLGEYRGLTLYTTFEPCLMCAATIIGTYQISRVAFAASDPTWRDLLEACQGISAIAPQLPEREQLGGPYEALAYVFHLTWCLRQWPGAYEVHDRLAPAQMALHGALWADLCRIADRPSR